jgi:chromosome segregation ATPase
MSWWQRLTSNAKLEALQTRLATQDQELTQLRQTSQELQQALRQAQRALDTTRQEYQQHSLTAEAQQQQHQQLTCTLQERDEALAASQAQLQESAAQQQALLETQHELEGQVQQLTKQLLDAEAMQQELWHDNETKQTSLNVLQQQLIAVQQQVQDAETQYRQTCTALENQLAEQHTLHSTASETAEQTLRTLQATVQQLEQQLAESQQAATQAARDQQVTTQDATRKAMALESAQANMARLTHELQQSTELLESMDQQLQTAQTAATHWQQCCEMQTEELSQLHAMQQHYNALTQQGEAAVQQLHTELVQSQAALRHLQHVYDLTLTRAVGAQATVLLRAAWGSQEATLPTLFTKTDDVAQALAACGSWLTQMQLCSDFTVTPADASWTCSWQGQSTMGDTAAEPVPQAVLTALLWAALNAGTAQQWHCRLADANDALHTTAIFS